MTEPERTDDEAESQLSAQVAEMLAALVKDGNYSIPARLQANFIMTMAITTDQPSLFEYS